MLSWLVVGSGRRLQIVETWRHERTEAPRRPRPADRQGAHSSSPAATGTAGSVPKLEVWEQQPATHEQRQNRSAFQLNAPHPQRHRQHELG